MALPERTLEEMQRKTPEALAASQVPGLCPCRVARGWTQKKLAEMMGVIPLTVTSWETGRYSPNIPALKMLCELLDTDADTLLFYGR